MRPTNRFCEVTEITTPSKKEEENSDLEICTWNAFVMTSLLLVQEMFGFGEDPTGKRFSTFKKNGKLRLRFHVCKTNIVLGF